MLFGNHAGSGKETIRSMLHSMGRTQWIVLLLLGLLLAVAAMPVSRNSKEEASSVWTDRNRYEEVGKSALEEKLEALLSSMEGVGEVQVMLMTGTAGNNRDLYGSQEMEVTGVLIAAQGADNPVTVQNIQKAVMALFQIEAHKISIMKMK